MCTQMKNRSICSKTSNFLITLFDTVSVYYYLNMVLSIIYYILIIFLFYCIIIVDILLLKKSGLQLKKPKLFNFYQLKIILFISYKLATLCNGVATGSFCI